MRWNFPIDVDIELGYAHFAGRSILLTEPRTIEEGDTIEAKFVVPRGVRPMTVRWILVQEHEWKIPGAHEEQTIPTPVFDHITRGGLLD